VTPGITALEYAQRRSQLANKLPKNAIAVLAASEVTYRATGIFNNYRQDSNFFYLTGMFTLQVKNKASSSLDVLSIGFNEPNALAIIGETNLLIERLN
jgi:intermediate cleaving peptidase 55